jgi:hypothetical protein
VNIFNKCFFISLLILSFVSCKKEKKTEGTGKFIHAQGRVLDKMKHLPIANARVLILANCGGGIGLLGSTKNSNGETHSDGNGNYDLTMQIEESDKDCQDFEFDIDYESNGTTLGYQRHFKPTDNMTGRIDFVYLLTNLHITPTHTSSLPLIFLGWREHDTTYIYANDMTDYKWYATCDTFNLVFSHLRDTVKKYSFYKKDSIYCGRDKDYYLTIDY